MLNYKEENQALEVMFPSKLDTNACMAFESELIEKINSSNTVIFNMDGVEFICSFFLRICLKTIQQKGKENFKIENLTPTTKKVFMIAGFSDMVS